MATVTRVVGTIGFVCKGEYDSATTYNSLNVVTYDNSLYLAIRDDFSNILPTDIDYWTLLIRGFESSSFYTKQDVDDNFYKKTYIDENFYNKNGVDSAFYKKSDVNTNFYDKTSTDNKFYNKAEIDGKIKTYTLTYENSVLKLTDNEGNVQPVIINGGGGSGSTVVSSVIVAPTLTSGTEIATIMVDDVPTKIYAPMFGGGVRKFSKIFIEAFLSEGTLRLLGYDTIQEAIDYLPYNCSSTISYGGTGKLPVNCIVKGQKTIVVNKIADRDNFYENLPNNIDDDIYTVNGQSRFYVYYFLVKNNGYLHDRRTYDYVSVTSIDNFKQRIISSAKNNYGEIEEVLENFENGDRLYCSTFYSYSYCTEIDNAETLDEIQDLVSSDNNIFLYQLLSYEEFDSYTRAIAHNGVVVRVPLAFNSYDDMTSTNLYVWYKTLLNKSQNTYYSFYLNESGNESTVRTKCFCLLQNENNTNSISTEYVYVDKMNDDETEMFIERY